MLFLTEMREWTHVIAHVDLDAFFASVHIKINPFLKNYPVIIGSDPQAGRGRGVVSTCSYEARKFGLHSGMPISTAYRQCPDGIYVCSGREISFANYHKESEKVMAILKDYSPVFQSAGLDEAYLDLTQEWEKYGETPEAIAKEIQTRIQEELSLPISVGVSETKSIAKIASDLHKPNGIAIIANVDIPNKLYTLPVRKIIGVGKKTEQVLTKKGLKTIGDIATTSREKIFLLLGDYGLHLQKVVHGINFRPVGYFRGERKSISSERTFRTDQNDWTVINSKVKEITSKLVNRLNKHHLLTRTVSIKIRFEGYITYTRSSSFTNYLSEESAILRKTTLLLDEFRNSPKKIRLIGVRVSNLKKQGGQTNITQFFA
ncbi:MAG: DNA polymerase IV [Candidatus Hodarchaeales archaeon]|jgi:nucleotidyltransferase/DNA polymerase involved in DNA repair